jgi:hypothetical protein
MCSISGEYVVRSETVHSHQIRGGRGREEVDVFHAELLERGVDPPCEPSDIRYLDVDAPIRPKRIADAA